MLRTNDADLLLFCTLLFGFGRVGGQYDKNGDGIVDKEEWTNSWKKDGAPRMGGKGLPKEDETKKADSDAYDL